MFEVIVFVYEHYWRGDSCPELQALERRLSAHGFEPEEIHEALVWLDGLAFAAQSAAAPDESPALEAAASSLRVYSPQEQERLGAECLGFISFLAGAGVLPPTMRELVIDRAMAAPAEPVSLEDLKIIVLMVYWSFGQQPDALVLDELCDSPETRVAH
jgi:Smg protein